MMIDWHTQNTHVRGSAGSRQAAVRGQGSIDVKIGRVSLSNVQMFEGKVGRMEGCSDSPGPCGYKLFRQGTRLNVCLWLSLVYAVGGLDQARNCAADRDLCALAHPLGPLHREVERT